MRTVSTMLFRILLLFSVVSVGCKDNSTDSPAAPFGRVMAIHASPNGTSVSILLDDVVAADSISFPGNSGYITATPGGRNLKVRVRASNAVAISAVVPIAEGTATSVIAIDSVAKISALVLNDTLTTPATNRTGIRLVHLSPNAPAVDITIVNSATDSTTISNRNFRAATSFLNFAAGTKTVRVKLAGTSTVVLTASNLAFSSRRLYTVFVRGFVGGTGATALGATVITNL